MIDIVFLLLIFFICAAAGAVKESTLATDLAAAGAIESTEPVEPTDPIQIETFLKLSHSEEADGLQVTMNDREFDDLDLLEESLQALAQFDASNPVILDIEGDVPVGEVIDVYDRCRRVGLTGVHFAADAPAVQ